MTHSMAAGYASEVAALRRELETVRAELGQERRENGQFRVLLERCLSDADILARNGWSSPKTTGAIMGRYIRAALAAAGERGA